MKYDVIIADPAWRFGDKIGKRGADANYATMTTEEIAALPVGAVASENAVLALWVPSSMLQDGLDVMRAWGFVQKQTYVWGKTTKNGGLAFGMGRLFRSCHEIALIGVRGRVYAGLEDHSQRNTVRDDTDWALNAGHSIKPDCLHESLEVMFPAANKLEIFARRVRPGWTCLGNEIDGRDLRESLSPR